MTTIPSIPPAYPVQGCRNCGGHLTSKPVIEKGPISHRILFLIVVLVLAPTILGAVVAWIVWPRQKVQTGVVMTCTACGLQQ